MKKNFLVFLAFAFLAVGVAFTQTYKHSRTQINQFVNEYVSAVNDMSQAVDMLVRNPERNGDTAIKKFNSAQWKINKVQAELPYYVDELTDSDMQKIMKASEKAAVAGAKLETYKQQNGYY